VGPARRIALVALAVALAVRVLPAQESTPPPTEEQLAAQERVRPLVNAIWLDARAPDDPNAPKPRPFWDITDRLIAIGPDVVPFLTSELDLMDPDTFHYSAYALGQLGGPEAEAALRKSIRVANSRGGRFGLACKRFALFSLALLGKPDVVDLMQQGGPSLHGSTMVLDYPLAAHLALIVGPATAPLLTKQLAAYQADPKATDQLEDTVFALGRAGDRSVAPALVPLLSHASPEIRAAAADALSRLGDPAMCEKLLPLLASKDMAERIIVATALERWKPEPCYKSMIGRLETEDQVAVRAPLYGAIATMGGESALNVFRSLLKTNNQFDQAVVIDSIGRIGSPKGLNVLRALLPEGNPSTVAHALGAIAAIGGEGALDTVFASTSDKRRSVASGAAEILTNLGDARVAPRRAGDLLELVREPVGNLSMRARILELSEALVALSYTEPIDDLKAAIAVQSDLEILDTLNSCVRRLELLKKHGDDDAAWVAELASPIASVRALADRRLAELGTPAAVQALTARLTRPDLPADERAHVLRMIGDAKTAGAAALVERNLAEPAYDAWELRDARTAAAYAARRLGGPRMAEALRASAVRRDGQDWATVVYLAVLEKGAALETLKTLRVRRMRYPESRRGAEDGELSGIISDLASGHAPVKFDVTPDELFEL